MHSHADPVVPCHWGLADHRTMQHTKKKVLSFCSRRKSIAIRTPPHA